MGNYFLCKWKSLVEMLGQFYFKSSTHGFGLANNRHNFGYQYKFQSNVPCPNLPPRIFSSSNLHWTLLTKNVSAIHSLDTENIHVLDGGYSKISKTLSFHLFRQETEKTGIFSHFQYVATKPIDIRWIRTVFWLNWKIMYRIVWQTIFHEY